MRICVLRLFTAFVTLVLFGCSPRYVYFNETNDTRNDLALKLSLKIAREKADTDFALIRVSSLPNGENIKEFSVRRFGDLKIGAKHSGRGILIVHATVAREVKIEVSYDLEGLLPDAAISRLESAAKTYLLSSQPQDYFSELLITLSNAIVEKRAPEERALDSSWKPLSFYSGGAGISDETPLPSPESVAKAVLSMNLEKDERFEPSDDAEQTFQLYRKSLELGIGDPKLALLSPGSRFFRALIPRSFAQQKRVADSYQRASGQTIYKNDSFAAVFFGDGSATLPIFLVRNEAGAWLVDEVKSWTYYHRFEDSQNFSFIANNSPFRNELLRENRWNAKCTVYKDRIEIPETRFDRPGRTTVQIGDWYQFELGWFERAKLEYQAQVSTNPGDLSTRWKLFHVLINLSEPEQALEQLEFLNSTGSKKDRELHEWFYQYTAAYRNARIEFSNSTIEIAALRVVGVWAKIKKLFTEIFYLEKVNDPCLRASTALFPVGPFLEANDGRGTAVHFVNDV